MQAHPNYSTIMSAKEMIAEDVKTEEATSMSDDEDDEDEDDFLTKVNVYLNSRHEDESTAVTSNGGLEGILRKSSSTKRVQFEVDDDSLRSSEVDASKTKQELLSKITRLTEVLRETENLVSIEQSKRKKKEKNLVKLAKELKKRIAQHDVDKAKIEEVSPFI